MSRENIIVLEEMINKYMTLDELTRKKRDELDGSYVEGIKTGFADYIDSVGTVREQTAGAITMTFGH